jgi:hypothetical protein
MTRYFLIFLFFSQQLLASYKHEVAICAIFQNDAPYLQEWIEFHKLQGVSKFYLYNNHSEDDYQKVLQPYIEEKEVVLIDSAGTYGDGDIVTWNGIQVSAYMDCIRKFGHRCRWIAFIDTDEFLFCPSGTSLPRFLKSYVNHAGVVANWLMMGTSYVVDIPQDRLMIELLTRCSNHLQNGGNLHIKSIVQPRYVQDCTSPHFFIFKETFYAADSKERPVNGPFSHEILHDEIRINHYWTRTERFLHDVKARRLYRMWGWPLEQIIQNASPLNEEEDMAIQQFVPALKKKINKFNSKHFSS